MTTENSEKFPSFDDIFTKNLNAAFLDYATDQIVEQLTAQIHPPILTNEVIWGCKTTTFFNRKPLISVFPGKTSLEALLRAISFIYDGEKNLGIDVPEIKFPGHGN